ncbi:hypothetical protein Nmel_007728, partial [Mimus melanotis]
KSHILIHTHFNVSSSALIPPRIAHRTLPCFPACGQPDSPKSLLLIMALEARSRGPCWVKWYPNFRGSRGQI